jgi:TATA-binding protein-associated factor
MIQFSMISLFQEEEDVFLQKRAAQAIVRLITLCVQQSRSKVSDKLIKNLTAFLCVEVSETPEFHPLQNLEESIISLKREEEKKQPKDLQVFELVAHEAHVKRRGAQAALQELCIDFGAELFVKIPRLKDCMTASLHHAFTEGLPEDILAHSSTFGQSIIDEFSILRTLLPYLDHDLVIQLRNLLPYVCQALQCKYSVVRFTAARFFASLCQVDIIAGMKFMVETILPTVADQHDVKRRQGAIECIYRMF